mgnify:CR=1 FL=1
MTITINGNGTVTGISAGGLPDGCIQEADIGADVNTIKEVDMWQVTTDFVSSDTYVASNWSRSDSVSSGSYQTYGRIGTGMTESSGTFTFPSTGIWEVKMTAACYKNTGPVRWFGGHVMTTKDNSNYTAASASYNNTHADSVYHTYGYSRSITLFDVTNTSTHKVKFKVTAESATNWLGDDGNGLPYTYVIFTRLGAT